MDSLTLTHSALAFFALAMTIISFWVKRSPWIWGTFLVLAFALGYIAKLLQPVALLPIGTLFILHAFLQGQVRGLARLLLVLITIALSLGLMMRLFPGFTGWKVLSQKVSKNAPTYNLYLNFSKPFIGIFVLAFTTTLLKNPREFAQMLKTALPLTLGGIVILMALALTSGLIQFDPKLPKMFWFFVVSNLIFVTIIEEAFWRGFVQKELFRGLGGKGFLANTGCVLLTALFFAALHYQWVQNISFLSLVFVAGVIYGSIYQYTKALEASIFAHWTFNLTHFFLFTYPVLQ